MAENQFRHIHLFLLMDFDGNATTAVVHADGVVLAINIDLQGVHVWITDLWRESSVVSNVHGVSVDKEWHTNTNT